MGKIIVPQANEKENAAFKMGGITLIESISEEDFLAHVIDFLNKHNVLHLATCKNNEPRCTPIEYFNNGLIVHTFCEGGGKIANLKANPKVSYSIAGPYHPAEDFFGASGLQVWGKASYFKKNDDIEKFKEIRKHSRTQQGLEDQGLDEAANSYNFNILTIEPYKIRRLSYREGFRNIIWKKED